MITFSNKTDSKFMWKDFVRNHLSFNRSERLAIVILCALIALCWILPSLIQHFKKEDPEDLTAFKKEVSLFRAKQDSLKKALAFHPQQKENILNINDLPEPFPFDPNTLSENGWQKLGMPLHEIKTIQHYLAAGGHFYKKQDLKKIYGLPIALYQHLEPYIKINPRPLKESRKKLEIKNEKQFSNSSYHHFDTASKFSKERYHFKKITLDINKADSAQWTKLYGIGPVLSGRIVHFRKALGGFYSIGQIAEVYGLPDSTFRSIKQQLKISELHLKKLNINTATVNKLKSHPYINYRLANAIKAFRDMHGTFDSVEGLKQIQLVNDQIYRKLVPYLRVK